MAVHAHPDDEVFSTGGILAKAGAAVEFPDETRKSAKAYGRRIAQLDMMPREPEDGDSLPGRGAVALGQQYPKRFCAA